MSQRDNNEGAAMAMVFAGIVVVFVAIFAAFYAYLAILTLVYTGACISAWNEPREWKGCTIFPEEARAFVIRGLLLCGLALLVAGVGVSKWEWKISEAGWWFIALTAYMVGSLGVQAEMSDTDAEGNPDIFPVRPIPVPLPPPPVIEASATVVSETTPEPFRFAEWDDDEARS